MAPSPAGTLLAVGLASLFVMAVGDSLRPDRDTDAGPRRARLSKTMVFAGAAGILLSLMGGVWYGMDAESKGAEAIDRKITAQIKANERYQDSVIAVLRSKTGLQPLSADVPDVPSRDNQTATGVRMESGDDLLVCVLNTRTGPASVTSHCAPFDASQR